MNIDPLLLCFIAGSVGAILKCIVKDGSLELPKVIDGKLTLGFLGSCFIGGVAGYLVDSNPVTAGLAGYAGMATIEAFIGPKPLPTTPTKKQVADMITKVALAQGVDPVLAVKVATCESSLIPTAININTDGSADRGIFQINAKWHPEITDDVAYDIEQATKFFCKAFKEGNLSWWNSTKQCWSK